MSMSMSLAKITMTEPHLANDKKYHYLAIFVINNEYSFRKQLAGTPNF